MGTTTCRADLTEGHQAVQTGSERLWPTNPVWGAFRTFLNPSPFLAHVSPPSRTPFYRPHSPRMRTIRQSGGWRIGGDRGRERVLRQEKYSKNIPILLANLHPSSRSTFSCESFLNFLAFKDGILDTHISAPGGWPTVSIPFLRQWPALTT
jgi:hypothetical protein